MSERTRAVLYWVLVAVLLGFGFVAMFSIGMPFLLVGVTLVVLWPVRHRAAVFWPALAAVGAFILGFVLLAPLGCTSSAVATYGSAGTIASPSVTTCSNILRLPYHGTGVYNPSLLPALMGAITAGLLTWTGCRLLARRRRPGVPSNAAAAAD